MLIFSQHDQIQNQKHTLSADFATFVDFITAKILFIFYIIFGEK